MLSSPDTIRPTRALVGGLAITQTVAWGVLFYALPVLLVPMHAELGWSRATIVGAYALAILISGLLAPAVGRHLDRDRPRWLMTACSALASVLVAAWSQVGHPVAFYAVWVGLGVAMAGVLYDAALPVVIKRTAPEHTRALLTVTLAGGLASVIFQPLTSRLTEWFGWRTALVVLAAILGAVTVPVHWLVLVDGPAGEAAPGRRGREHAPELRERRFWILTGAFAAITATSFATLVLLVAYLHDQGWSLQGASLAGGTLGLMQLPGRIVFSRVVGWVPNRVLVPAMFALPGIGVVLLYASQGAWWVWPAVCLLGLGQGAMVLLRATVYTDLYGVHRIGVLNGASAVPLTTVRAAAPLGATVLVGHTAGYGMAFALLAVLSLVSAGAAHRALA